MHTFPHLFNLNARVLACLGSVPTRRPGPGPGGPGAQCQATVRVRLSDSEPVRVRVTVSPSPNHELTVSPSPSHASGQSESELRSVLVCFTVIPNRTLPLALSLPGRSVAAPPSCRRRQTRRALSPIRSLHLHSKRARGLSARIGPDGALSQTRARLGTQLMFQTSARATDRGAVRWTCTCPNVNREWSTGPAILLSLSLSHSNSLSLCLCLSLSLAPSRHIPISLFHSPT
jgi:hypothetical protein